MCWSTLQVPHGDIGGRGLTNGIETPVSEIFSSYSMDFIPHSSETKNLNKNVVQPFTNINLPNNFNPFNPLLSSMEKGFSTLMTSLDGALKHSPDDTSDTIAIRSDVTLQAILKILWTSFRPNSVQDLEPGWLAHQVQEFSCVSKISKLLLQLVLSNNENLRKVFVDFLNIFVSGLSFDLSMSTVTGLADLIEDEIIPIPIPMEIALENLDLYLNEDLPPTNITISVIY
ncbi:hypothetical protein FQA39_LY08374 [Lamprigera yunnana]|nr:hypothetical protein FQA39_LY08374 [Lamprigera yunnana]